MSSGSETLRDKDIISDSEIEDRIDYLAFLEDDDMTADDRELWADEIGELIALRALVAATGGEGGDLISEDYWKEYAAQDADESFDLHKSGVYKYFDYDSYADDLQTEFSQVEFLGTTYYYQ